MEPRNGMQLRSRVRETAIGLALALVGVRLVVDGYSMLQLWTASSRCTWGVNCIVQIVYVPVPPWLPLVSYLALFLLAGFGGLWAHSEWKGTGIDRSRRRAGWFTLGGLALVVAAWSATLFAWTLLSGHVPLLLGPASNPATLSFYVLLLTMPLVAVGIGSSVAVHGLVRRRVAES